MLPLSRSASSGVAAVSLVLASLAPAASYASVAVEDAAVAPAADRAAAKAGVRWHRKLVVGRGKRAVKVFTCASGSPGNYLVRFKVSTRKSSDRNAPRIWVNATDGGHTSAAEFSLFPGDLTERWSNGYWGAEDVFTVKVRNQGKVRKKSIAVGSFGAC